ncbi:hypothetical protein E1A91_D02G145000v1 [Gossypium mustelinum]|uniref:Uncharacterized protein n=1 Tax=Gossypium mustelinum TaxID=34275 RepID=A0A5D2VVV9_GOSMU|nr:hypothetical protein E1A91_D02G145000v1 [Gossypium mustelinum]
MLAVIAILIFKHGLGIPPNSLPSFSFSALILSDVSQGLAAAILMPNLSRISMAATAYSKGELEYAAYLSDQRCRMARQC